MFILAVTEKLHGCYVQKRLQPVELMLRYAGQVATGVTMSWNYERINELNHGGMATDRLLTSLFICIVTSRNAPTFRTTDDRSTESSRRTNADWSISSIRRCELHHRNSKFDRFNNSRLDAIHLSTTSMWWFRPNDWPMMPMFAV